MMEHGRKLVTAMVHAAALRDLTGVLRAVLGVLGDLFQGLCYLVDLPEVFFPVCVATCWGKKRKEKKKKRCSHSN